MQFIVTGRQAGKSHMLADWARESDSHIVVVANTDMAKEFSGRFGIPGRQVMTYRQIITSRSHRGRQAFYAVDDAEQFIQLVFGAAAPVEMVTATGSLKHAGQDS